MSAYIVQDTFSGDDLGITLGNNDLVRPFAFGPNWTRIRIGILCAMTPNSTSNHTGIEFFFGACARNRSWSTATALGCGVSQKTGSTWTYTAGGGSPYYATAPDRSMKVNGSRTDGGTQAANTPSAFAVSNRRTLWFVDLTKSGDNVSVYHCYSANTADISHSTLLAYLECGIATPSVGGVALTASNTINLAMGASNYAQLDCLNIYHTSDTFPMRIYDIAVQRMS